MCLPQNFRGEDSVWQLIIWNKELKTNYHCSVYLIKENRAVHFYNVEFGSFQYSGLLLRTRVPFSGFSRLKTAGVQVSPGYGCFSSFPRFLNQMIDSFIYYTVQQNICHVRHMKANKTFLNPFWSLISNFGSKILYHLNFAFFSRFSRKFGGFCFFRK